MNIDPVEWRNGYGKVRWQPRVNDLRLVWCGNYLDTYKRWAADHKDYTPVLYLSRKHAVRKGRRELNRRKREFFSEYQELG